MNGDADLTWKPIGFMAADLLQRMALKRAQGEVK